MKDKGLGRACRGSNVLYLTSVANTEFQKAGNYHQQQGSHVLLSRPQTLQMCRCLGTDRLKKESWLHNY